MDAKTIANILLSRQNARYSFVIDGATRVRLTPEGFEYAKQHGWIELDEETQAMRICLRANKMAEIKQFSEAATADAAQTLVPTAAATKRDLALNHAADAYKLDQHEVVSESSPTTVERSAAGGEFVIYERCTAPCREFVLEYNPQPTPTNVPQSMEPAHATTPGDYNVGDAVIMAEDGKTFQATVQAKQPDGSLVLSFGGNKPAKIKPSYGKNELQRAATSPGTAVSAQPAKNLTAPTPSASTPAMPSGGPVGPGIGRK